MWSLRSTAVVLPIALACAGPRSAAAQPLPPLDEYQVRAFDTDDGLLAADVTGLAQTSDGYLYVAGGRGLARFDGYRFERVPLPGARSHFIYRLFQDRQGRLWLLAKSLNLLGYHAGRRFHALPRAPVEINGFWQTADGAIWLGSNHGLLRLAPEDTTAPYTRLSTADGLPSDTVNGVFDLPDGERVAVTWGGLARMEPDPARPGGVRFVPVGPRISRLGTVRADAQGLWIGCGDPRAGDCVLRYRAGRLTRYGPDDDDADPPLPLLAAEPASVVIRNGLPGHRLPRALATADGRGRPADEVAGALRAHDGALWVAMTSGREPRDYLARWRDGRLERIDLRDYLQFKDINHLLDDREGSLWVGTDRGLLQLVRRKVYALTRREGLAEGFTVPVLQTRDGAMWVGTWGGGLHRYADGRLTRRYTVADGLPDHRVRALYEAGDGTLWVGTSRGFAAIRGGRVVLGRASEEVRAFAETPGAGERAGERTLWVATISRLLRRTPQGFVADRPGAWTRRGIWALHTARDGALWIGSEAGLFRLAGDSLRAFGEADGLRSSVIVSIHEEGDGTLWFGTYEDGLYRYRDGRFAAVTTREGLYHDGVWRMLEDGRGGIWMSSDQGIFRVDRARLHAVVDAVERGERPASPLAPLVFTEAEGMPNRECNRASPGGWRLRDGRLVFNNLAGVVVIDPTRATERLPPATTVLQDVVADGREVELSVAEPPTLARGTKQLAFDFAVLSFVAPGQNRYRYRLDGYDDGWVDAGTRRHASYTNLPPGHYTFRVQGANQASGWSEAAAAFTFTVPPLLWQTWWLRALAAAVLVALLAAAYRTRVARLLELERLRLRIASDLHDDVGSNLSSIALLSEMLQGHDRLDDLEQRQLQRINVAAEETIGALRDIIWLVDPKHDGLADLVVRMRTVAGDLMNGTAWAFEVAAPVSPRPLGMAFMRSVLLIYKEALHNVARHARARHVTIAIADECGRFVLRIEDDGVGFDERAVRAGQGLASMRRRAAQIHGRLDLASVPRRGTRVTLSAPMA
ncbi:MAG TPA: two-component regulator propeller domain-containing protein [Gemmatimonadaceae bacterium]|nr:two-component regulator propeller domain-containing protein [Gemmatimonadaceae bacterium]